MKLLVAYVDDDACDRIEFQFSLDESVLDFCLLDFESFDSESLEE